MKSVNQPLLLSSILRSSPSPSSSSFWLLKLTFPYNTFSTLGEWVQANGTKFLRLIDNRPLSRSGHFVPRDWKSFVFARLALQWERGLPRRYKAFLISWDKMAAAWQRSVRPRLVSGCLWIPSSNQNSVTLVHPNNPRNRCTKAYTPCSILVVNWRQEKCIIFTFTEFPIRVRPTFTRETSADDVTGLTTRSSIKARIAFEAAVLTISNRRIRLKKSWA